MHQLKYIPLTLAVILSACSLFCSQPGTAAEKDMEISSFARTSLKGYVNNVLSEKNIGNFGFKTLGDARKAELGKAYPMLSLDLREIKNYREGDKVASLKTNTGTTWFPVTVSGEVVAKLEVLEKENRMIAGDFGAAAEALRISQAIAGTSKALESRGIGASGTVKILRIPYMKADFLYVSDFQSEYLIPAMPLPGRFELNNGEIYAAVEVLARMKKYAQQIEEGMIR
jgi:hypothetical protein